MSVSASLSLSEVMSLCRPLVSAGASLHWLVPGDKIPIAKDWSELPNQSIGDLERTHRVNANIGIRPGQWSRVRDLYLHIVDLDIRRADLAHEAWAAILAMWPNARAFPSVISGSGGESRHLYFLSKVPYRKKKLAKSAGWSMVFDKKKQREVKKHDWEIDILGTGAQAVIPPSIHPETGKPYLWERELDLSMPFLLEIQPEIIEKWQLSEPETDDFDLDDIESDLISEPINMDSAEIDRILEDLPEDWVEDRDQWLIVGQALHHQFRGTNEGFEVWCEWSRQSAKFDAKDSAVVWKSFKGNKNPIRMPTLIQAANVARLKREMDLDDDGFAPPAAKSTDLSDLLAGPSPAMAANAEKTIIYDPEWESLLHRTEEGEVKATLPNAVQIVWNDPRTRGLIEYNEFWQRHVFRREPLLRRRKHDKGRPVINLEGPIWTVKDKLNGEPWTDTHDFALRQFIEAPRTQGGYGFKLSDRDLIGAISLCAQRNRFHPVRERILSQPWDGKPRVETLFVDLLGCDDTIYHRQASLLTLVGMVTRVFEPGHKFDFVPILEGVQGKGKSTFIQTLGMDWYGELTGDISKVSDMIAIMAGKTVIEIGELSAMARHEVNELKAFVSRPTDEGRLPYEKRSTVFRRQCIFIGSTNNREYLRDETGNRRYWPIECKLDGEIDNDRLRAEMPNILAEAYHLYLELRRRHPFGNLPLYMSDTEARLEAESIQNSRRVETSEESLAGQISAWLNAPIGSDDGFTDLGTPAIMRNETCMAQVWQECLGRSGSIPQNEAVKVGKAMQIVGWIRTTGPVQSFDINKKYGACRVYTRP